jgi:hypothetical protein
MNAGRTEVCDINESPRRIRQMVVVESRFVQGSKKSSSSERILVFPCNLASFEARATNSVIHPRNPLNSPKAFGCDYIGKAVAPAEMP